MGYLKTEYWENEDYYVPVNIYECDRCEKIVKENYPHYIDNENIYCRECAFILRKINEKQYLNNFPICLDNIHADVINEEVIVWVGNIHPLDKRRNKLDRRCKRYRDWRKAVLKRDNNQCKICKSKIELEAHHIKEFSKYKDLRFIVDNGITLCKNCHKNIHRKREI